MRGTNKANNFIVVRQNGNYAISQMSKIIRNAKRLESPASCSPTGTPATSLTLLSQNDEQVFLELSVTNQHRSRSVSSTINLTDSNAVRVTNLRFNCTQADNSNTVLIYITFTASQASQNPGSENSAELPFSTSIAFRNYQ